MMYKGKDGAKIAAEHPDPIAAAQATEFSYSAQNPMIEATKPYDSLHLGFGQQVQQGLRDYRYRYASGVDASVEGSIVLGPYIPTVTPSGSLDTTNGITKFFEIGGSMYALNGRYGLKRTADSAAGWGSFAKDFGVGKAALQVIVHKQNAGGASTLAYVAMGDSEFMYKFDGTTWTQHASLYALAFAVAGRELYRAHNVNQVSKVDENADPWVAGNWSAANSFYVGDSSSAIVDMTVNAAGILTIFKTDGVYILDETGQDTKLYAGMRFIPNNADNGKFHWLDNDQLHVTYGGQHYEIGPDMGIKQTGPELFADNDSVVHGYITAGLGTPYCSYAGMYNPDSGHSFLMKYGAYGKGRGEADIKRIDAWHGSLTLVGTGGAAADSTNEMASKKVIAMHISTLGAPSLHQQLFIGYSNGTISNIILPCTPNPKACTSYQYAGGSTPKAGHLYFPHWHGGFPNNEKVIRAVTCTVQFADATDTVTSFFARTTGSGSAYTLYPSSGVLANSSPGNRSFVGRTVTFGDFAVQLYSTGASATTTPTLSALSLHYSVNPPLQLVMDLEILAEDGLTKRDGSQYRLSANQIQTNLRAVVDTTLGVTVVLPDQASLAMQIKNYREETRWDEVKKRWRSVIVVRAIQSDVDLGGGIHALS